MFAVGGGERGAGFLAWTSETCDKKVGKVGRMNVGSHFRQVGSYSSRDSYWSFCCLRYKFQANLFPLQIGSQTWISGYVDRKQHQRKVQPLYMLYYPSRVFFSKLQEKRKEKKKKEKQVANRVLASVKCFMEIQTCYPPIAKVTSLLSCCLHTEAGSRRWVL